MASSGLQGGQQYYRPYLPSDSELSDESSDGNNSDSGSGSGSSSPAIRPENAGEDIDLPDFSEFARKLRMEAAVDTSKATGPSFATTEKEDAYGVNRIQHTKTEYSPYFYVPPISNITVQPEAKLITTAKDITTIVMLQSRDRDKTIFPQPTDCSLMLPRIYKNVTGFSIAQLNLTSAFFYFRQTKENLSVTIYEKDRIKYNSLSQPTTVTLNLTNTIREGSYNITSLLDELNTQLNKTPLFYDFPNGFSDFLPLFSVNGDITVNFNYPGDNYYDSLKKVYVKNPTRDLIASYYFQQRTIQQLSFTIQEVRLAYYYPVLKEALVSGIFTLGVTGGSQSQYTLDLTYPDMTIDDVKQYLIYSFTGIRDTIANVIIQKGDNINFLDEYRLQNTFRYSLVNKYICSYDPTNNRVTIQSSSLNQSLVNLLNAQFTTFQNQLYNSYGTNATKFNTDLVANTAILSMIQSMYDYLQVKLAESFAINYGTFSKDYFINLSNTLLLRPGTDAAGISKRYDPNVQPFPRSIDLIEDYKNEPNVYWPSLSTITITPFDTNRQVSTNMGYAANIFNSNRPYNVYQSNVDMNRIFINDDGLIYTDSRRRAGDILVTIEPNQYTIFRFRSKYRQNLQVETLPRQTAWKYPEWNIANKNQVPDTIINYMSETPYSYISGFDIPSLQTTFTNAQMNTIPNYNFGIDYESSYQTFLSNGNNVKGITIAQSNGLYFRFTTPLPDTSTISSYSATTNIPFDTLSPAAFKYPLTLNFASLDSNTQSAIAFPSDFVAFVYQDSSAFAADITDPYKRNENPLHYKNKIPISIGNPNISTVITTYGGQEYFMIFRSVTLSPETTRFLVVPSFAESFLGGLKANPLDTSFNPLANPNSLKSFYVDKYTDPDYLRIPIGSTLQGLDPDNQVINVPLTSAPPVIGYDASNVSNDLTDYMPIQKGNSIKPINPSAQICVDPINRYVFQYNSPYNYLENSYFFQDTNNAILQPITNRLYTWNKPSTIRQYKIVHYYGDTYLRDLSSDFNSVNDTDCSPYINPYTVDTTNGEIPSYQYEGGMLKLGNGVCGFTFLPADGTWEIDRITFKDNFVNQAATTNRSIHLLGIFYTSEILSFPTSLLTLDKALAICMRKSRNTCTEDNVANQFADASLGTYYSFATCPSIRIRSQFLLTGFNQNAKQFVIDPNAYYSAISFTLTPSTGTGTGTAAAARSFLQQEDLTSITKAMFLSCVPSVVSIQNMVGSAIPYPFAFDAYTTNRFYDGISPPTGQGVVLSQSNVKTTTEDASSYSFPQGGSYTMSQYALSIPIVNSHIHYKSPASIISDPNAFQVWTNPIVFPTAIHTSVPSYVLFQDGNFVLSKYFINNKPLLRTDDDPQRTFTTSFKFTLQDVFPDKENTSLLGISGNSTSYLFAGVRQKGNTQQLRFKLLNPITNNISELPVNSNYTFPNSYLLQHIVFTDTKAWFMSIYDTETENIILQGSVAYGSNAPLLRYSYPGDKSELQMPASGNTLYFTTWSSDVKEGFSNITMFNVNYPTAESDISKNIGYTVKFLVDIGTTPNYYTQLSVNKSDNSEEVLLTNSIVPVYKSKYFRVRTYQSGVSASFSNAVIDPSIQEFKNAAGQLVIPKRIYAGAKGSKWALFNTSPFIMANRNDSVDSPTSVTIAWQVFFPLMKIELRKVAEVTSPILDKTGLLYPEYPHTVMFAYSNFASLSNDLFAQESDYSIVRKWGCESKKNFVVSDIGFNGYNFNSYLINIPLYSNYVASPMTLENESESSDYFLAIRGYFPTEKFQTLMRFYLPNQYNFGFLKIKDMLDEINLIRTIPEIASDFNPSYYKSLQLFDSNFTSTFIFGSNTIQQFNGSTMKINGLNDFLGIYNNLYTTFSTKSSQAASIKERLTQNIQDFVSSNLKFILPPSALKRQRFTDPIVFQILWKDNLSFNFVTLDDEWGLGWNLGFNKENTGFATYQTATSFFKIQQDFIYLRLSPEFNMNRVDAGGKEDYTSGREPTGLTSRYYCKLLLTNFGGNATTFIHNPITFNPVLNRLSKLTFQWVDPNGSIIDNVDSEWNMTVTLTEKTDVASIPDRMPFEVADPRLGQPLASV